MLSQQCRRIAAALSLALSLSAVAQAQLVYDGFAAGGASPNFAAGQYRTGTGFAAPSDFIQGQAPTTLGFAATAWTSSVSPFVGSINPPLNPNAPSYDTFVYYRAENNQFTYTDASSRVLATTPGQVQLFRNSGSSSSGKQISRALNIGTNLPATMYVSMLTQVSSGAQLNVQLTSSSGSENRPFLFGINASGNPYVIGTHTSGSTITETIVTNASVFVDPSKAHLLVAKITDNTAGAGSTLTDRIELFLDPQLESEVLNTPIATFTGNGVAGAGGGNFYVAGNAAWTINNILFDNLNPSGNMFVMMDELRMGSSWASVTTNTQLPEPSSCYVFAVVMAALAAGYRAVRKTGK